MHMCVATRERENNVRFWTWMSCNGEKIIMLDFEFERMYYYIFVIMHLIQFKQIYMVAFCCLVKN